MNQPVSPTKIIKQAPYNTEINFLHVDPNDQEKVVQGVQEVAHLLTQQLGFLAVNLLRSTDGTRICTYIQWQSAEQIQQARQQLPTALLDSYRSFVEPDSGQPRLYDVVYADDRSVEGVTTISYANTDVIFINEITTQPSTQARLLELVVANNEEQSLQTPGYRSANFHKSTDGERAVNYSLWDSEAHLIAAITAMASEDINLEETMEIATPDFRFYKLVYTAHA